MIKKRLERTLLACFGFMALFFLLTAGCSGIKSKKSSSTLQANEQKDKGSPPLYYDFADVLIPSELKMDNKSTYVVQTPGFLTGVLALKGRVERNSLVAFFETNMAKDNWRQIGSFKSPQTSTILLFQKENRWCVININEKELYTYVEIGVAPSINDAESGLLK